MKTHQLTILFAILTISCFGQENRYNDWFDLNLKGKPKSIKEITVLSLTLTTSVGQEEYLDLPFNQMLIIGEFYFNPSGILIKEYHKDHFDNAGKWTNYKIERFSQKGDSIVLSCFESNSKMKWQEERQLDSNNFIRCRVVEYDTIRYERDYLNRIIKSRRFLIGIDFPRKIEVEYEYNENGDIKSTKEVIAYLALNTPEKPSIRETTTFFSYTYDFHKNWIVKVSMSDNEVSTITQREIKYE
jgi:hypothetical protein